MRAADLCGLEFCHFCTEQRAHLLQSRFRFRRPAYVGRTCMTCVVAYESLVRQRQIWMTTFRDI